jgi:hypothetical protein
MRTRVLSLLAAAACALHAAEGGGDQLARIRAIVSERMARIPNYTCLETIDRRWHDGQGPDSLVTERVRLEVAAIEGKDQFSWPGGSRFDDRDIQAVAGHGLFQSGEFSVFPRTLFGSASTVFTFVGEQALDTRRAIRYDYRVPRRDASYALTVEGRHAFVGFHGSFWVDPATLDLVRLEAEADEIPASLRVAAAKTVIEYAPVAIGGGEFLLPRSTDSLLAKASGQEERNFTRYSRCREFAAESSISFEDEPAQRGPEQSATAIVELPPGTFLETELVTPIVRETSAVGDLVEARVLKNVTIGKGQVVAPQGAVVQGRIVRLETEGPLDTLALRFTTLRAGGNSVKLDASVARCIGTYLSAEGKWQRLSQEWRPSSEPSVMHFRTGFQQLPKGLALRLRTLP